MALNLATWALQQLMPLWTDQFPSPTDKVRQQYGLPWAASPSWLSEGLRRVRGIKTQRCVPAAEVVLSSWLVEYPRALPATKVLVGSGERDWGVTLTAAVGCMLAANHVSASCSPLLICTRLLLHCKLFNTPNMLPIILQAPRAQPTPSPPLQTWLLLSTQQHNTAWCWQRLALCESRKAVSDTSHDLVLVCKRFFVSSAPCWHQVCVAADVVQD